MYWSVSYQLLPGEEILDDSAQKEHSGIKPTYSVLLTNKRALFRFDVLGSKLTQSFFYHEIDDVSPQKRLYVNYLCLKTKTKDYFLNTSEPDYWTEKIRSLKEEAKQAEPAESLPTKNKNDSLLAMLNTLKENAIITEEEFQEKISLLK